MHTHAVLSQLHACCAALGFDDLARHLPPRDAAAIMVVAALESLRAGEAWQDVQAELAAADVEPTQEDA